MSTMSAAEARLDADIRPEITVLRSRSSYPNRHRQADPANRPADESGHGMSLSPLVARAARAASAEPDPFAASPRPVRTRPVRPESAPGPIRLTRRGRVVVAVLAVLAAVVVACLAWLVVANRAQASSQVQRQSRDPGMTRVVVQPGATLWSIAVRMDPGADPRAVIQQVMNTNALNSPAIQAGQVLWVPRG